jgi:hypothetical protein
MAHSKKKSSSITPLTENSQPKAKQANLKMKMLNAASKSDFGGEVDCIFNMISFAHLRIEFVGPNLRQDKMD